jgi:2,3-bisphosphoglycerate-dependent phosphoglycerate mutase
VVGALRLTLLRHGRSRADDEGLIEGRYDSPLTQVGREQARRLGEYWASAGRAVDRVVSSSLMRAVETAQIVAGAIGASVEVDPAWMERDNGPLAGLDPRHAETHRRFPIPDFRGRFEPLTTEGGESDAELARRAEAAIEALVRGPDDDVLVVSHGRILSAALAGLLGSHHSRFVWGDTAYAEVVVERDREQVTLIGLNHTPHLEQGAS